MIYKNIDLEFKINTHKFSKIINGWFYNFYDYFRLFFTFINQTITWNHSVWSLLFKKKIHKVQSNNIKINQHSKEYLYSSFEIDIISFQNYQSILQRPPIFRTLRILIPRPFQTSLRIYQSNNDPKHRVTRLNFSDQIPF